MNSAATSFTGYMKEFKVFTKYYTTEYLIHNSHKMHYNNSFENPYIVAYWRLNDTVEEDSLNYTFTD